MSLDVLLPGWLAGWTLGAPLALLLIPALALLFLPRLLNRDSMPALLVADLDVVRRAARSTWRIRLRYVPTILRIAAILLLVVALARPREGIAETVPLDEGIDVVVSADISSSMLQGMGDTSRIQALRDVLDEFIDEMQFARLGLVAFQSRAIPLSPLTYDHDAIRARIEQLAPGLVPDGTAIGLGVAEGLDLLQESPARSRVVVLLTDGQNNTGEIEPMQAARMAEAMGIRLYTIGFHSGFGLEVDQRGLTEMAEVTGGQYFDATSPEELAASYAHIAELERATVGERRFVRYREFAPWLALAALGLLAVDGLLRATWFRRQP